MQSPDHRVIVELVQAGGVDAALGLGEVDRFVAEGGPAVPGQRGGDVEMRWTLNEATLE